MNDSNVNDLVYWVDIWTHECGIGIVISHKSLWIELISGDKYKILLFGNYNISNIKNHKSLEDFIEKNKTI